MIDAARLAPPTPRPAARPVRAAAVVAALLLDDSGVDQPFTAGRNAGPQDVISRAGGDNVFADLDDSWTTVGWEPVTARDPQVILVCDYGGSEPASAAEKETLLRTFGPTATTTVAREGRFVVLPYAALVSGPRNPQAIVDLAAFLRRG